MALTAFWLRFAPRQFARGRDYEASYAAPLTSQAAMAFTVLAEGALRVGATTDGAVWQFAALTPDGPFVLARSELATRDALRARVIWALALPLEYLQSNGFALHGLSKRFAALHATADIPDPFELELELEPQPPAPAGPAASMILAKYLEAGSVRVAADTSEALNLFCQTLELLPPADRSQVSFSTAKSQGRTLEVDVTAPPAEALSVGEEPRAIATLWCLVRTRLAPMAQSGLSLTRKPLDWLCSLLATEDIAARFRGLCQLVTERLEAGQHAAAFALLRRAMELQLMRIPSKPAALALAQLEADGYLGPEHVTPPIWITRLAVELRLWAHLPPALLTKVLRPGTLAFLLGALQQPSSSARLQSWVAALQQPMALEGAARRELALACGAAWRELIRPRRGFTHRDLARSVALLALYEQCRGAGQPTGATR